MATKQEIKSFMAEWIKKPFPKISKGDNKGNDKWDVIDSKLSKHLKLVKTTDNDFLIKIVNDGYKGIMTNNIHDLESIAELFSTENMKEIKTLLIEFGNSIPNSKKTKSII